MQFLFPGNRLQALRNVHMTWEGGRAKGFLEALLRKNPTTACTSLLGQNFALNALRASDRGMRHPDPRCCCFEMLERKHGSQGGRGRAQQANHAPLECLTKSNHNSPNSDRNKTPVSQATKRIGTRQGSGLLAGEARESSFCGLASSTCSSRILRQKCNKLQAAFPRCSVHSLEAFDVVADHFFLHSGGWEKVFQRHEGVRGAGVRALIQIGRSVTPPHQSRDFVSRLFSEDGVGAARLVASLCSKGRRLL